MMSSPGVPASTSSRSVPMMVWPPPLPPEMFSANSSNALAPAVSVASTRSCSTLAVPVPPGGVPVKVRVAVSKDSHEGSGLPSASVAAYARLSPRSMSVKVSAATVKLNGLPAAALWSAIGCAVTGASFTPVMVIATVAVPVAPWPSAMV